MCDMAHWQLGPIERAQRGARWWDSEGNQPSLSGGGGGALLLLLFYYCEAVSEQRRAARCIVAT